MDSSVLIAIGVIFVLLVLAGGLLLVVHRRRQQASIDDPTLKAEKEFLSFLLESPNLLSQEDMNNDDFMEDFIGKLRKECKVTNGEEEKALWLHLGLLLQHWGCDQQRVGNLMHMNRKYKWYKT